MASAKTTQSGLPLTIPKPSSFNLLWFAKTPREEPMSRRSVNAATSNHEMLLDGFGREIQASEIRGIIGARRRRHVFGEDLFSDPAWDILLELYASELEHQRHSIGSLTASVPVPATTVLRWITELERLHLVRRSDDPQDQRRIFISLSSEGSKRMISFFEPKS